MSVETVAELKAEVSIEQKDKNQFSKIKEGIEKISKAIQEKFKKNEEKTNSFFKNAEDKSKSFSETLTKAIKTIPFIALMKVSNDTLKRFVELDNFVKRTGVSEDFTQKMIAMANASNVSANSITSALEKISQDLSDFRMGTGNINPYAWLGVDLKSQNPEEVFDNILSKIKEIDNVADRSRALRNLGLDENLANLNNSNLNGVNTNLFLNKKDRQELEKMNKELNLFKLNLVLLRDKFIALASPIKYFFELVNRLIKSITGIIEKTIGLERFAKILSAIIFGFTIKLKPAIAVISALALAIDDFLTYLRDGDSIIGDFVKWLEKFGIELNKVDVAIIAIGGSIATAFAVSKITAWGNALISAVKLANASFISTPLGRVILGGFLAYEGGKTAFNFVKNKIKKKDFDMLLDMHNATQEQARQLLNSNYNYNNSRQNNINIENNYNISGNSNYDIAGNIVDIQKEQMDNYVRTAL